MPKELDWPEWNRKRDPELWDFYARNMLEPGWPGELTEAEYLFIREKLSRNRRLRSKWGFDSEIKPVTFDAVQAVARWGEPSDPARNSELVEQTMKKRRRSKTPNKTGIEVSITTVFPTQLQFDLQTV